MNDAPETSRQWPRWLIVSLMANMILVGLLAGFLLQAGPKAKPDGPPRDRFAWASRDDGARETMRRVFVESFKASSEERAARAEVRARLGEVVAADPYDATTVRETFRELRAADDAVNEAMHDTMVDTFATLSVEDRQKMAWLLKRGPGDHRSKRGSGRGERGGPMGDGPPPRPPPPEREP